ncbi:UNVERIFIED_CONTAM: Polyprotein P3 [Sesamum latifolium]|uniref:Polyprotein P3 n=1 Tax=Sesamum latifolium TaxID=2727402 RepID=A0AAW2SQF1_9LAMI
MFKVTTYSKKNAKSSPTQKLRSLIPSKMRHQTTLAISCGKVLKVKAQTMVFIRVQSDDEDDRESVASSNYISNGTEEDFAQIYHVTLIEDGEIEEEDVEDAPIELEEGVKATVDELREDVFAWSYKEMPGLDPKVAVHHLSVKKGARPVKQGQRRFRPELIPLIETKVNKLIEVGFIREVKDLNNACPKDDFPLPIAELMIDATTGHEALSFMDGSSGYNQIRMAPADEELTAFRTLKGIYCYKVMPFGLKNAGATYQRAMQRIFDDMLHKNVECYVDDLVVKSKKREDHLYDLRKVFERLRRYQLKMNPSKCAFELPPESFLDSSSASRDVPFEWDEACDKAFKSIKSYLMKPPVLVAPVHGRPLILYVAAQERSVGILLAQKNDEGKENSLYYLSRTMTPNELKYSPIEKLCLALIFAIQKLKHYFQSHRIHLVSKANPLKYVMTKPVLSDKLSRWRSIALLLYIDAKLFKQYDGISSSNFWVRNGCRHKATTSQSVWRFSASDQSTLGLYEIKKPELLPYHNYAKRLMGWLGNVELEHLPRGDNKQADALVKLASILSMTDKEARISICKSWIIPPIFSDDEDDTFQEEENHVMEVFEIEEEDWRQPLVDYLKYESYLVIHDGGQISNGEQLALSIIRARSIDGHLKEFSCAA